jgi:dihydroorotate dehydrogenase electron transfer subunit
VATPIESVISSTSEPRPQRQQFVATVASNENICREHYRLVFSLPRFPATEPGQFIQISCRDVGIDYSEDELLEWTPGTVPQFHDREMLSPLAFLRRPFSLAGRRDTSGGVKLEIIHRIVGVGTDWLSRLKAGDEVSILGPLGNRFTLPSKDQTAILIGGGVGIPPMLYLAQKLRGHTAVAFCGATTKDLLALTIESDADANGMAPTDCIREFAEQNIQSIITTDDGSYGFRGFVTQALEKWLDQQKGQGARGKRQVSEGGEFKRAGTSSVAQSQDLPLAPAGLSASKPCPLQLIIYTCGPEPMMKRVAEIAIARGIPCQIAVERAMACGMGTCQSCCIRVKKPDPTKPPLAGKDWCWRLACTDGPVFTAEELLW